MMEGRSLVSVMSFWVLLFIFLEYYEVIEGRFFSRDEHSEMKARLRLMNIQPAMNIQTKYGDIYDCVDIHRQPGFDHPLLKNHTLQMEPSSYPTGVGPNNNRHHIQINGLEEGGCQNGTVPIRRAQKGEYLQSDTHLRFGKKASNAFRDYAVLKTPYKGEYYGARAYMNVWNPKILNVDAFSLSQIWILAGPKAKDSIEVGWIVNPQIYGDYKTRLFTYWTADHYGKTGCYNLRCPGFIQVNKNIPVDESIDQVSTYKGEQYDIKIDVFKDPKTGNWFLLKDDLVVGYWPSTLFNYLNTKAEAISWGGEVARCGGCPKPEMGSGYFPEGGYGQASYMREIKVIENKDMVLKEVSNAFIYETNPNCYRITYNQMDVGNLKGSHIIYGGPGGTC